MCCVVANSSEREAIEIEKAAPTATEEKKGSRRIEEDVVTGIHLEDDGYQDD